MSDLYVGKIDYAQGSWARLQPLAVLGAGQWNPLPDRTHEFPHEGLVFAPPTAGLGNANPASLWLFRRAANTIDRSDRADRWVVVDAHPAIGIVDLSDRTLEQARVTLTDEGVEVPRGCTEQRVVVLLAGGLYGVFRFPTAPATGPRRPAMTGVQVPLMAVPPAWIRAGTVEGRRILPVAGLPQPAVVRRVNWSGDAEFVQKVLVRVSRHQAQFGDDRRLPGRETLQRIALALEREELTALGADDPEFDLERLQAQWPRLVARFEAAEAMSKFVLESDIAMDLIEDARHKAVEAASETVRPIVEAQVREALRAEIEAAEAARMRALEEAEEAQSRRDVAAQESSELVKERDRIRQEVQAFETQLQSLTRSLERELASVSPRELPFARTVIDRLVAAVGDRSAPRLPDSAPPWSRPRGRDHVERLDAQRLGAALASRAKAEGLASLAEVDAFLRAGELVLVTGPLADRAVMAYADVVCGGAIWSTAVDPSVIGLDDLWSTPPERSPTAFAAAWTHAERHPDVTVLACLRGLDASPFHLWAAALAAVLRSADRPPNLLVAATPIRPHAHDGDARYPGHTDLLRWMVPVRVAAAPAGSLGALDSLGRTGRAVSTLRWPSSGRDLPTMGAELVAQLAKLDAEDVCRVGRLATVLGTGPGATRLVAEWARLLGGDTQPRSVPWLGHEDLGRLRFQD